jgi:hypothetical protein
MAIILVPLATAVAGILLSVPYAFAIWHNPLVYVGVFLPVIWGALIYVLAGWSVTATRLRNPALAALLAVLGTLPGFVLHWAVYADLFINTRPDIALFAYPDEVAMAFNLDKVTFQDVRLILNNWLDTFNLFKAVSEDGIWSVKSFEVKGLVLRLVWLAELLILLATVGKEFAKKSFALGSGK